MTQNRASAPYRIEPDYETIRVEEGERVACCVEDEDFAALGLWHPMWLEEWLMDDTDEDLVPNG